MIKEEIFGSKKLREVDVKIFLREFQDMYRQAYKQSYNVLSICISKVEEKFMNTNQLE